MRNLQTLPAEATEKASLRQLGEKARACTTGYGIEIEKRKEIDCFEVPVECGRPANLCANRKIRAKKFWWLDTCTVRASRKNRNLEILMSSCSER